MPIKTAKQLVAWIKKNTTQAQHDGTPHHAALWFVSYENASSVLQNYSTKDVADLFQNGVKPATMATVQSWIDDEYDCAGEDDAQEMIEKRLKNFFEVE